ncbi:MAG TPA: hypothetical protein VFD92_09170 [Candidatus Binatia bacterium]|nr:hypothetical protein [Candidatus Binatia bacterium]
MLATDGGLDWPDTTLLPVQLTAPGDPVARSGVKALMIAVLEDAIACLGTVCRTSSVHARMQAVAAVKWIRSTDRSWPFAFESICDVLAVDCERLRDHLLASYANRVHPAAMPYASARRMEASVRKIVVARRRRRRRPAAAPAQA